MNAQHSKNKINGRAHKAKAQPRWQRIVLISILAYEAFGCLFGGAMLLASPDGSLLGMPVEMLHNRFADFLIPGIFLLILGIVNLVAVVLLLRVSKWDGILSGIAVTALSIWFIAELIVINAIHWLHAMWGLPVLIAGVLTVPLIIIRHNSALLRSILLACGLLSSLWFAVVNIYVLLRYQASGILSNYHLPSSSHLQISVQWIVIVLVYCLFFIPFAWGIWLLATRRPALRMTWLAIVLYSVVSLYWFPMYKGLAVTSGITVLFYTLNIFLSILSFIFMLMAMKYGAVALDRTFRIFIGFFFAMFVIFGASTFIETLDADLNLQISLMDFWSRIITIAFMSWLIVFAILLILKVNKRSIQKHYPTRE